jgi:urea carboxylase-associated protein 2
MRPPSLTPPAPTGTSFDTPRPSGPPPAPERQIEERLVHEELLPGGAGWSGSVKRGLTIRLTALDVGANVSLICFNRHDFADRYNLPDTLKGQHTAKLTTGFILMSDMGRAMISITGDTVGWHDPLGGFDDAGIVRRKWGEKNYQAARNDCHRNSRDHFLIELAKWGLGQRDLIPCVNFFSKVSADDYGRLKFHPQHARPGDFVDLRAEMDLLVVLTTCHHPLDDAPTYSPKPLKLQVWRSDPPAADDYCRTFRPENERAFFNTEASLRLG